MGVPRAVFTTSRMGTISSMESGSPETSVHTAPRRLADSSNSLRLSNSVTVRRSDISTLVQHTTRSATLCPC